MILFLVVFCVLIALGFTLASAISDFKSMTIPNIYAGGIVLAFIPAFAADYFTGVGMEFFAALSSHLIAGGLVFALTLLLFAARVMGAGDSKLCSALALWVGLSGLAAFIFYMALVGALLAVATKIMNKKLLFPNAAEGSWIALSQKGAGGVPYGIAILCGAVIAFYQLGYFSVGTLAGLVNYTENGAIALE